jgi:cobalamin biosynthetic protein CobC
MRSTSHADPFALPNHGGDLSLATARFGRPAEGWLDLSTGINPFAYPVPALPPSIWQRLPDSGDDYALREVAAAYYGVADPDLIASAPGTQSILQTLPRLRPFSRVAVIGPTYGEYARCWGNAGHDVVAAETLDRAADADVVVLCHPNNPDGRRFERDRLLALADQLNHRGGLLVVDEAFMDQTPEYSLAGQIRPGLLVLRSIGKFFGLGGLRLGFAIGEPQLARVLRQSLGPWAVSGAALMIGAMMLADQEWIAETRHRLTREMTALNGILGRAQLSVVGGSSLFTLVNASRAWALYEYLGQHGILARPFAMSPRWLRFGLPASDSARQRLDTVLAGWA